MVFVGQRLPLSRDLRSSKQTFIQRPVLEYVLFFLKKKTEPATTSRTETPKIRIFAMVQHIHFARTSKQAFDGKKNKASHGRVIRLLCKRRG
jgi:hypothetical protein